MSAQAGTLNGATLRAEVSRRIAAAAEADDRAAADITRFILGRKGASRG